MFCAIDKLRLMAAVLNLREDVAKAAFTGIELSDYLQRASRFLHPDLSLSFLNDWAAWTPSRPHAVHLSRFVASYAIRETQAFCEWLDKFDVLTVTDVFTLGDGDLHTFDLGLPMTLFDFSAFVDTLVARGWRLYLSDLTPDHHAGKDQSCFVARVFGAKESVAAERGLFDRLRRFPDIADPLLSKPLTAGGGRAVIDRLKTEISSDRWAEIRKFKESFPIWGPTPDPLPADVFVTPKLADPTLKLIAEHPQIIERVNAALARSGRQ